MQACHTTCLFRFVMTFNVAEELVYHSPAANYPATVYKHERTGLCAILLNVPGPLCYLSIVVPTGNASNRGLPHTLEHCKQRGINLFSTKLTAMRYCCF